MLPQFAGRSRHVLDEFARALLAGGLATLLDVALLSALVSLWGWDYLAANACSFSLGTAVNYAISVRWVFPHRSLDSRFQEALLFALAGIAGLAVSQAVMFLAVEKAAVHYLFAKAAATGCHFAFNFSTRKLLLFREPKRELS